jgi:hypothetical protein
MFGVKRVVWRAMQNERSPSGLVMLLPLRSDTGRITGIMMDSELRCQNNKLRVVIIDSIVRIRYSKSSGKQCALLQELSRVEVEVTRTWWKWAIHWLFCSGAKCKHSNGC